MVSKSQTVLEFDSQTDLTSFVQQLLSALPGDVLIDFSNVDEPPSTTIAQLCEVIRHRVEHSAGKLTLFSPPQMLAHTLYKMGVLRNHQFAIENQRLEEPYTG